MEDETKPSKRGRKPLGKRAMTPAERKRASRSKKAGEGSTEVMIRIEQSTLDFIDLYAEHVGESRSRVIEEFVHMAANQISAMMETAGKLIEGGASEAEVASFFRQRIRQEPESHLLEKCKEVLARK